MNIPVVSIHLIRITLLHTHFLKCTHDQFFFWDVSNIVDFYIKFSLLVFSRTSSVFKNYFPDVIRVNNFILEINCLIILHIARTLTRV